jgi:hypothetical protein
MQGWNDGVNRQALLVKSMRVARMVESGRIFLRVHKSRRI